MVFVELFFQSPEYGDIRMSVIELPNFVTLEELFTFKCKLSNNWYVDYICPINLNAFFFLVREQWN